MNRLTVVLAVVVLAVGASVACDTTGVSPAGPNVWLPGGGSDAGADAGMDRGDAGPDSGLRDGGESIAVVEDCAVPVIDGGFNLAVNLRYNNTAPDASFQSLDVAWPLDGGAHPMVIVIHGGGFVAGDKAGERTVIEQLAELGYTAASINYRLDGLPDGGFPQQVQDTRCALRYLRQHAATWSADPSRVAAIGTSAGGYHVDMLGLTPEDGGALDGACPWTARVGLSAVASFFGPADLRDLSFFGTTPAPIPAKDAIVQYLGTTPDAGPAIAIAASPVTWVSTQAPPFLLLHGTADSVVYLQNSVELWTLLRQSGVPATLMEFPDGGHGFPIMSSSGPFKAGTCTVLSFLNTYLGADAGP